MILGVGVDQVEVERIRTLLEERPERAGRRLFTETERRTCDSRRRSDECFAARFAAKEAFVKALGCGLREGMSWTDIEIRTEANGRPHIALTGAAARAFDERGGGEIHLSFTHEGGQAIAFVVLERAAQPPGVNEDGG